VSRIARELIAAGRDVHALHIIAAEELDPPRAVSLVIDPESSDVRRYMADSVRDEYLRSYAEWREVTATRWLASGAAYRTIVVGKEPVSHSVRRVVRDEPAASRAG